MVKDLLSSAKPSIIFLSQHLWSHEYLHLPPFTEKENTSSFKADTSFYMLV